MKNFLNEQVTYKFRSVLIAILLLSVTTSVAGYFAGRDSIKTDTEKLPSCQEDEFLYPKLDYKGPGKNTPSEYGCVHIDAIREGN